MTELTQEDRDKYRKKFDLFDRDKDGLISIREFNAVGKVLGFTMNMEELEEMFGRRDLDASGGISFEEFVVAMKERAKKAKEKGGDSDINIRDWFRAFDRRKKGYFDADDALPLLRAELGFDEDKTEAFVDMFDKNRDYRITLPEFGEFVRAVHELKKQCQEAFQLYDQNKDGFVDVAEAVNVMEPKGYSAAEVAALVQKADDDQDGKLNYKEFLKFWNVPILPSKKR